MREGDRPQPRRVLGYARVSSRDQGEKGTSLEAQRDQIERYCAVRGWPAPVIRVEVESGGDEHEEDREKQRDLEREAGPGDVVLVSLTDRWSRDIVYTVKSVRALVARKVGWISIDEHIDAATDHGDEALGHRALQADHERRRIKKRTVGRRRALLELGYWCHGARPPFGFRRGTGPEKLAHLVLEPAPDDVPILLDLFRHCIAGRSVADLAEWLSDVRPDRGWSGSLVKAMLRNRVYIGEIKAPSGWIKGKHAALVSLDLWSRAQDAKRSRDKGGRKPDATSRTSTWLVRPALARCGHCGGGMRSAFGRRPEYAYLLCRDHCGAPMLRSADVDAAVEGLVLGRLAELRDILSRPLVVPLVTGTSKPRDFAADRQRLESSLERIQRGYVDGLLDAADVARERDRVRAGLERLARDEGALERGAAVASPAARAALLADMRALERGWRRSPVARRRQFLELLAVAVVLRHGEPLVPSWRSEADLAVVQTGLS